jgi:biopolymer transport protein ExbD
MSAAVGRKGAIHGINITPLVDIFLVLLILVMISSSLVQPQAIEVQVPRAAHAGAVAPEASGLVLMPDGSLLLDGIRTDPAVMVERLRVKVAQDSSHSVLLSADAKLPYEKVVEVLDLVKSSGARKYALSVKKEA